MELQTQVVVVVQHFARQMWQQAFVKAATAGQVSLLSGIRPESFAFCSS
jgi:hypothetical protein